MVDDHPFQAVHILAGRSGYRHDLRKPPFLVVPIDDRQKSGLPDHIDLVENREYRRPCLLREIQQKALSLSGSLGDVHDCEIVREIVSAVKDTPKVEAWLKRRHKKRIAEFHQQWADEFGDENAVQSWMNSLRRIRKPAARVQTEARSATRRPAAVA